MSSMTDKNVAQAANAGEVDSSTDEFLPDTEQAAADGPNVGSQQVRTSTNHSSVEAFDASPEIREVYGNEANIRKFGLPTDIQGRSGLRYYFFPTWRSQLLMLMGFFLTCILAMLGSNYKHLDWTVLDGKLFAIGNTEVWLSLPLLTLVPGAVLGHILFYMYNSRYIIDHRGVEAQIGLVSLSLRQPRVRFEDIRGVEPKQSLLERILGIGSVLIGSAMSIEVEIVMEGVPDPRAVQLLIQTERDRRLRAMSGRGAGEARIEITGD